MSTSEQTVSIIQVSDASSSVCCPPKEQAHWNQHPRVYLDLTKKDSAQCPYCGNQFKLVDQ